MNEIITAAKKNRFAYNDMKKKNHLICAAVFLKNKTKFTKPVMIKYNWFEKHKRRDLDNIAAAKKFINDSLVKCGILQDDSYRYVKGFTDSFHYEKGKTGVEIEIIEILNQEC